MKYTDSKEFNNANFISRNPTEIAEPEQNYEKEYVINAIAQLTTEYGRIGRLFNQSESAEIDKMADLHDTLAQPDTCNCKKTITTLIQTRPLIRLTLRIHAVPFLKPN